MYDLIQQIHKKIKTNIVCDLGKTTGFNMETINESNHFGQQLKYYRKKNNIRAKDMAKDLDIGYNTIWRLEEKTDDDYSFNHKSVQIINRIIDYLNIREQLNYTNNEYLDFILNKQVENVQTLLKKYSRKELSTILNVVPDTISRWISNDIVMSKQNYYKIKKMLEN